MLSPAISVVIPLYQSERTIGETLRSVVAQTFTDFEILVIDDGSSDNGPDIAREFADARIHVVSQTNRGLAGARNSGIREARGRFIALVDADDLWHPQKLEWHYRHLNANPRVGVSFSHSRLIDEASHPLGMTQSPSTRTLTAHDIFCRNPVGNGSAPVLRREALDAIAFHDAELGRTCWFDESFRQSEDIECWTRIAATTTWLFSCIAKPLTDYRITGAGLSANVEKQLATWRRFRAKVASYAPALEAAHGNRAEAYQLRYLARRAVRSSDRTTALDMMRQALRLHPRMLREEPVRTLVTIAAAAGRRLLPNLAFTRGMEAAVKFIASRPRLRV
jgi:glycosyltransferase involved in cell wall biosynthesis